MKICVQLNCAKGWKKVAIMFSNEALRNGVGFGYNVRIVPFKNPV